MAQNLVNGITIQVHKKNIVRPYVWPGNDYCLCMGIKTEIGKDDHNSNNHQELSPLETQGPTFFRERFDGSNIYRLKNNSSSFFSVHSTPSKVLLFALSRRSCIICTCPPSNEQISCAWYISLSEQAIQCQTGDSAMDFFYRCRVSLISPNHPPKLTSCLIVYPYRGL